MFTDPLPDEDDYRVEVSKFAESHYFKQFAKKYKGKQWVYTLDSIFQDLRRVHAPKLQFSQQVDQLKHRNGYYLFKYDFAIAQTKTSPKASGNRCIVFLDSHQHVQKILFAYCKTDVPKNQSETDWMYKTIQSEYRELWDKLK